MFPTRSLLIFALVLTGAFFPEKAGAAPKTNVVPAPPQPVEQRVSVRRGGSVEVPLRIYGTRAQTLGWIVRQQPAHGKLSGVRATGAETAVVTYRPPTNLLVVSDRFTFSVRSNEGVSAPVAVTIAIVDDEPRIVAVAEMDFGALLTGATAVKVLDFTNAGGGIAEGGIEVSAPWRIEGARRYKLAAGDRHVAKIVFAPERAGKFGSEVRFTSQPDRVVAVRGVAEDALAVAPAELVLAQTPGFPLRAGSFELRNNTDAALEVAVVVSPRLVVQGMVHVAAGGVVALAVQVAEKDVAPLEETIAFTAGKIAARLSVRAAALAALVRARPQSVAFRRGTLKERIVLGNEGGRETKVHLAIGAPFSIGESGFTLAPGAEREVVVTLAAASPGSVQAVLKVTADAGGFDVPVNAEISSASAAAPAPRRPPAAAPVPREPDPPEVADEYSGVFPATVISVGENSATFQWQNPPPKGAKLRCLLRSLSLDADGELVTTFTEYPASKIEQRGKMSVATVEKLEPGNLYFFHIDAATADGATPMTFAQIRTPAPPPRAPVFSFMRMLIALMLLAGGASIWQRKRGR